MSNLVYQNYSNKCKGWTNPSSISLGPQITSLSTYHSPAGSNTIITINGINFYSYSQITFGTLSPNVYFINSTILQFYIPTNLPYGIYPIQVFNGSIGSNIVTYTLDDAYGLTKSEADTLYLSKVHTDTSTAPLTTFNGAVNFGSTATFYSYAPVCGITATFGDQLVNKDYVDNTFGTFNYILNFSSNAFTNAKQSIIYNFNTTTTITKSNVKAKLDNYANIQQVYTFGQQIPNRWVAVGNANNSTSISYSSDGILWKGITGSTDIFSRGRGVAWNGQMWVAVGEEGDSITTLNNTIAYSYDGIIWTGVTGSTDIFSNGRGVAWNGNMWVAVGQKATNGRSIAYSYDGKTWKIDTYGNDFLSNGYGVAWNGQMWVAVGTGSSNSIAYSYNGISWIGVTDSNIIMSFVNGIAWNGNMWVAGGEGTNTLAYSYDGINDWTGSTNGNDFLSNGYGVAWNGTMWVAVGLAVTNGNSIIYSYDGINWIKITNNITTYIFTIAWNGTMWIATGNLYLYSYNGITWIDKYSGSQQYFYTTFGIAFNNKRPNTITFNNLWVAGAYESDNSKIAYSYDGKFWINSTNGNDIFQNVYGVASNETMWIAVGNVNTIAYSYDGKFWINSTNGNNIFGNIGWCVASNGTMWVAGGEGTNTLAYSNDGKFWYASTNETPIFKKRGFGVASNGTMWVAVGDDNNTIAYSYDGKFWYNGNNIFGNIGWCVASNGTMWVAGGEGTNTLAYSNDGKFWYASTNENPILIIQCRCLAWNGTMWVAGGQGSNSLAYSYDGKFWYASTNGNDHFDYCLGVAWNGTMWVAGGYKTNNSLAYSYDGINWIGIGIINNNNPLYRVHCVATNSSLDGQVTIPNNSIVLNQYGNGLSSQLDVVTDSYYNTGFTNFSIAINSTS
jgi:hypothetical protein